MKALYSITSSLPIVEIKGNTDVGASSISLNSKTVEPNAIFVAIDGNLVNGHTFIPEAIKNGARVIVYQETITDFEPGVTYIKVDSTKEALGIMSTNFYGHPSRKLKLVGVTGTNGKTTTATLLYQLFRNLGYKVGLMGTVVNKINDTVYEAERTTPDAVNLNKLLKMMVEEGCEYCFMEVSSHSVAEKRIIGLSFAGGVFTNVTLDHLDYHQTIENYRDAKKRFFDTLSEHAFALSNIDDPSGVYMLKDTDAARHSYALKKPADFSERLETKLLGEFNAYNILAVYATAMLLGQDEKKVKEVIKNLDSVEGRFQYIKSANDITGIVDYAHTPDALQNVLETINAMKGEGKIISVFGCGGDRDKSKRPIMAKIGYDLSDIVILTTDNPRSENIEDILSDMSKGIIATDESKIHIIVDRLEAIEKAVSLADSGDLILLAGKGHEKYQEIHGVKTHFDDMEELQKCFAKLGDE